MIQHKKKNIILLPTNEPSFFGFVTVNEQKQLFAGEANQEISNSWKPQHLYVLSNENIKNGDWYILIKNNQIVFADHTEENLKIVNNLATYNHVKKIIASSDKSLKLPIIPVQFIKTYVLYYGMSVKLTEIAVEYENMCCGRCDGIQDECCYIDNEQQLRKNILDNSIYIKKVKTNFSLEEVNNLLDDLISQNFITFSKEYGLSGWDELEKWKQKNLLKIE